PGVRVLLGEGAELLEGIGETEPVEEHLCLAELQMCHKVVARNETHDPVMLPSRSVEDEQGRGPADQELFHGLGSLVPETLAFDRCELLLKILLHFPV